MFSSNKPKEKNETYFDIAIFSFKSLHQPYPDRDPSYPFNIPSYIYAPSFPLDFTRILKEMSVGMLFAAATHPLEGLLCKFEARRYPNPPGTICAQGFTRTDLYDPKFIRKACLYGPILEELAYRGLCMPLIRFGLEKMGVNEKYQMTGSIVGSSIIFAGVHPKGIRLPTFVSGLAYASVSTLFGGSLWASTTAHAASNSYALRIGRKFGK